MNAPDLAPLPPHSPEAEQWTVGALLLDPAAWQIVSGIVTASDFYRADHRLIFGAFERVQHEDGRADLLSVLEELKAGGTLEAAGGLAYLQGLLEATPSAANAKRYAEQVAEDARRRDLAALGAQINAQAMAPGADVGEIRARAEEALATIAKGRSAAVPLDLRDLATREPPPRAWAVLYWIAMGHAHLLVGLGGIGKSTLLMQLAACLAIGHDFIDRIERPFRVLLWLCEDDADEIWRRLVAIARWLGAPLDTFADRLVIVPRLGLDNVLMTSNHGRAAFTSTLAELRAGAEACGAEVVILDNVAHLFGGDENARHDVTTFINGLQGALPGRAVILAGHPSRAEGSEYAGSAAWENACRARLFLGRALPGEQPEEDPDDVVRFLARRKANYSARDWRRFRYADGVLVPDGAEPAGGGVMAQLRAQRAERIVLDGARRLREMGVRVTDGATSPQFLPRVLLDYKLAEGCTKRELADATRAAMLAGKLVRAEVGKYAGNRSPMFGLVVQGE